MLPFTSSLRLGCGVNILAGVYHFLRENLRNRYRSYPGGVPGRPNPFGFERLALPAESQDTTGRERVRTGIQRGTRLQNSRALPTQLPIGGGYGSAAAYVNQTD